MKTEVIVAMLRECGIAAEHARLVGRSEPAECAIVVDGSLVEIPPGASADDVVGAVLRAKTEADA